MWKLIILDQFLIVGLKLNFLLKLLLNLLNWLLRDRDSTDRGRRYGYISLLRLLRQGDCVNL